MKHITIVLMTVFLCSICYSAIAQRTKIYLEPNRTYQTGKIYMKRSIHPITANKIVLFNDTTINYYDRQGGTAKSVDMNTSKLNYIKIKTGTKAGEFALTGGGFMLLISLYSVLMVEDESMQETGETTQVNWIPSIVGFTAAGAVFGGLIGVFSPKYKNFYVQTKSTAYTFGIYPQYSAGGGIGVTVKMRF